MSKIKVRKYKIGVSEYYGKITENIRIVVIGDLHNKKFGDGNSKLVEKIMWLRPDLILSVGDLTVCKYRRETHTEVGLRLIKRLSFECPIYCILGNHELRAREYQDVYPGTYDEIRRGLNLYNVRLLENDRCDIDIKGLHLTVHGVDIPLEKYKKFRKQTITDEEFQGYISLPEEERYNLLLAHTPQFFSTYAKWGADLTCCGHYHGGTMRLPFLGGVASPQYRLFPKYDCGLFSKEDKNMVVTAGLGTHSLVPRINNPSEVTLLELYRGKNVQHPVEMVEI